MSWCAAGGLIYSSTVRIMEIKRCVLRQGAEVQLSTVLVHWLWLVVAKRLLAYSSVYCAVTRVVGSRVVGLSLRLQCARVLCPVVAQS
jgi:hypothetical protein